MHGGGLSPLFFIKNIISGIILALIFQPAHVIPEAEFIKPNKDLSIENNFAIHQMETTVNFAPKSKIFNWFVGGFELPS